MTTTMNQNFEIWVEEKMRVEVKKKASRVRETADQLSCQSMFHHWASIQNGISLPSKFSRFFFSLARLIEDSERQLNSTLYDS